MSAVAAGAAILTAAANHYSAQEANRANKKMSDKTMAFQKRMSNTQYQRGVTDPPRS